MRRLWLLLFCLVPLALAAPNDQDNDGYPDATELVGQDRVAFADWFAAVAESQFYGINSDWNISDQDCAGLLRYAFKNALVAHTAKWRGKFKYLPAVRSGPVRAYGWPPPVLGYNIYRVAPGAYRDNDVQTGRLANWASAKYLVNFSSVFVSKDWRNAKRGDLLFFLRPRLAAYHSMVYLGGGMVVYHTGDIVGTGVAGGEVRLLSLATLTKHPDTAFHASGDNPNFLGFYRWKILR